MPDRNMREHWRRIGHLLERIRRQELRKLNYEENWKSIDALLQIGFERATPRATSGLVELHRLLARARR